MRLQNLIIALLFVAIASILLRVEANRRHTEFLHQQKTDWTFEDSKQTLEEIKALRKELQTLRDDMEYVADDAWERGWDEAVYEYNYELDPPYGAGYYPDGC